MSFIGEAKKALGSANSWAALLSQGKEENAVQPSQPQAAYSRDSDIQTQELPKQKTNIALDTWQKIPEKYRPVAAIAGSLGAFFLVKRLLNRK
jgi:hypothetical protein